MQDIRHQRYPSPWSNWPQRWIQVDRSSGSWVADEFSHRTSWAILIWYQIQKLWNLWKKWFPWASRSCSNVNFSWMTYLMYTVYNSQPARRHLACDFAARSSYYGMAWPQWSKQWMWSGHPGHDWVTGETSHGQWLATAPFEVQPALQKEVPNLGIEAFVEPWGNPGCLWVVSLPCFCFCVFFRII